MVSDGPHGLRKQDQSVDHLGVNEPIKASAPGRVRHRRFLRPRPAAHTVGEAVG
jgi:beta-glucosidase